MENYKGVVVSGFGWLCHIITQSLSSITGSGPMKFFMWGQVFSQGGMHSIHFPSLYLETSLGFGVQYQARTEESLSEKGGIVEMFSMVKKMNQSKNRDRKKKGKLVDDGFNSSGGLEHLHDDQPLLLGSVDSAMLASQEIHGPPTPAQSHGCAVVVEKEIEKPEQHPKDKPSILLFTNHIKPRLRWTPKLHARFTNAINELGGAAKATPKAVQTVMDLDGLTLFHVKSHLQKFRMGKVTVKDLKEMPKIRHKLSTSRSNRPVHAKGHAKAKDSEVRKSSKARKREHGQLYLKLQEARQRFLDSTVENEVKRLFNQYIAGANDGLASMSRQNLARVGTMATTPSLYPNQENACTPYNTLERIKECLGIRNQPSSSEIHQPQSQNVAHSAEGTYMTSNEFSFPSYNSTNNNNNKQIGLKEQPRSHLPHIAHSATRGLMTSLGYAYPTFDPTKAVNVQAGLKEQTQIFLPQYAAHIFQPQNAAFNFQSTKVAHVNQSQNAFYSYQPTAYFATNDFPNSNGNYSRTAYYSADNSFPTSTRNFSESATYSPGNDFATTKGNYSGSTAYSVFATDSFLTSNSNYSGSATPSAANNLPTSQGNYSRYTTSSAANNFPTFSGNRSGNAAYSASNDFPTSNGNYFGSAIYSAAKNFPTSNENYSGSAASCTTNDITASIGTYSGTAASSYSAFKDLTTPNQNYSENTPYCEANNLSTSERNYSGTEYQDDLTAALAAFGDKSLLGTLDEDPVDAYLNWDNPDPNTQDLGLIFNDLYSQNN